MKLRWRKRPSATVLHLSVLIALGSALPLAINSSRPDLSIGREAAGQGGLGDGLGHGRSPIRHIPVDGYRPFCLCMIRAIGLRAENGEWNQVPSLGLANAARDRLRCGHMAAAQIASPGSTERSVLRSRRRTGMGGHGRRSAVVDPRPQPGGSSIRPAVAARAADRGGDPAVLPLRRQFGRRRRDRGSGRHRQDHAL